MATKWPTGIFNIPCTALYAYLVAVILVPIRIGLSSKYPFPDLPRNQTKYRSFRGLVILNLLPFSLFCISNFEGARRILNRAIFSDEPKAHDGIIYVCEWGVCVFIHTSDFSVQNFH